MSQLYQILNMNGSRRNEDENESRIYKQDDKLKWTEKRCDNKKKKNLHNANTFTHEYMKAYKCVHLRCVLCNPYSIVIAIVIITLDAMLCACIKLHCLDIVHEAWNPSKIYIYFYTYGKKYKIKFRHKIPLGGINRISEVLLLFGETDGFKHGFQQFFFFTKFFWIIFYYFEQVHMTKNTEFRLLDSSTQIWNSVKMISTKRTLCIFTFIAPVLGEAKWKCATHSLFMLNNDLEFM